MTGRHPGIDREREASAPNVWGRTRRKFERMERRIAALQASITGIAQAITAHQAGNSEPFGRVVGHMMESQAKQFDSTTSFLQAIHQIGIERAGAALGRRGGKKSVAGAKRDRVNGRFLPRGLPSCRLCQNPLTSDFSVEEFSEHQKHKGGAEPLNRHAPVETEATRVIPAEEMEGGHYHADGTWHAGPHDAPPVQYPLPTISLEHTANGAGGGVPSGQAHADGDNPVLAKTDLS
jgi:hypothetical protein